MPKFKVTNRGKFLSGNYLPVQQKQNWRKALTLLNLVDEIPKVIKRIMRNATDPTSSFDEQPLPMKKLKEIV